MYVVIPLPFRGEIWGPFETDREAEKFREKHWPTQIRLDKKNLVGIYKVWEPLNPELYKEV